MKRIAVVGLGYVGLPLAAAFGEKRDVVGFDINPKRIAELKDGVDFTREVSKEELAVSKGLSFAESLDGIRDCQIYIVTVPTPIDEFKSPDLTPLVKASESVGSVLKRGDIVIYESTVYPGATEEVCVPILEKVSGLVSTKGLGLIDIIPIPHYDEEGVEAIDKIVSEFENIFDIVLLTDDQAIVVEGENWQVVNSSRSELEHEWFKRSH